MQALRFLHPDKIRLESLGTTEEGRHIYLFTMTMYLRRGALPLQNPEGRVRDPKRVPVIRLSPEDEQLLKEEEFMDDPQANREQGNDFAPRSTRSGKPIIFIDGGRKTNHVMRVYIYIIIHD